MKTIFEIVGTVLTCVALLLISEKMYLYGFIVNIIASIAWMGYAKEVKGIGLLIVNMLLIMININGLMKI